MNRPASAKPTPNDPLPSSEEINSLQIRDVEIIDRTGSLETDTETDAADATQESSLDVGNLLEKPNQGDDLKPILEDGSSLVPADQRPQLERDPKTGELVFKPSKANQSKSE
ncbi:hypothetical protein OAA19_00610 [Rubripirellula sp.]|nr:hypothetical protein [Rubripirellula sp.]MDB4338588.1 hypothetical protein [Rubripirellula sp.]